MADKGYGFIMAETGEDIFFHISGLANKKDFFRMKEGDVVEYNVTENQKGQCAVDVTLFLNI